MKNGTKNLLKVKAGCQLLFNKDKRESKKKKKRYSVTYIDKENLVEDGTRI